MSVIEGSCDVEVQNQAAREVIVDLRLLREWSSDQGLAAASIEMDRVRQRLIGGGVAPRSATRIASAVARYAFLTCGGCAAPHRLLWRLSFVDGVPPEVLAPLTWQQIRLRLREIVVSGDSGTMYFPFSIETSRLLMLLRDSARHAGGPSHVFTAHCGGVWNPDNLGRALSMMSLH